MKTKAFKKVFAFALALVMVLSLSAIGFAAEAPDAEENNTLTSAPAGENEIFIIEGTVLKGLTEYGESLKELIIPDTVTEIGNDALTRPYPEPCQTQAESIIIPDTVTTIGQGAFCGIPNLTEIVIPDSVTYIGDNCFQGCENLVTVKLSANLTVIPEAAFGDCGSLTSVTVPKGVTQISKFAFGRCSNLKKVNLPETLTTIVDGAFAFDNGLELTLPKSVTTVESGAFSVAQDVHITILVGSKLESFGGGLNGTVTAPASLKSLFAGEEFADVGFTWIDDSKSTDACIIVTDGDDVTLVGLTDYGKTLTHIDIPDVITVIGNDALSGFMDGSTIGLESVTIPDTVTTIGQGAFCAIPGLTEIVIPDSVTSMGSNCFQGCENLASVKLSANLTTIPEAAFAETGISSINIPASVTAIKLFAFGGCANLENVTLREGLVSIAEAAFISCNLKEVTLPKSVTTVDNAAFGGMAELKVTVPAGSKLEAFGPGAFAGTITAPASLKDVFAGEAFANTDITWIDDSKSTDACIIVTDGDDVTLVGLTDYGKTLTHIDIPDGVTAIGNDALSGFMDHSTICLESVTIPDTVTAIGQGAFCAIPGLTEIVIPDSVTSMGSNCFQGCENLTSVKLSANLTAIPEAAFAETGISSIDIPASVTAIKLFAFGGCANLEKVTLHEGLVSIAEAAFISCNLKEVVLPKSVTTVDNAAFGGMKDLKLAVPDDSKLETFGPGAFAGTITAPESMKAVFAGEEFANTDITWNRAGSEVPQTGDSSHMGLWMTLACVSLFGIVLIAAPSFKGKRGR